MKRSRSLRRPLVLALGGLLLLSAVPEEAYSQKSAKGARRAPIEVPASLKKSAESRSASDPHQRSGSTDDPFPDPSVHGFFMLGKNNVMLYHSSVFDSNEHSYQMIVRTDLSPEGAANFYRDNYYANIDTEYMWISHNAEWDENDEFEFKDKFTLPNIQAGTVTSFNGEISILAQDGSGYPPSGHDYVSGVTFTLGRVMYFRHYDLTADYPDTLTYLLFGVGEEDVYMAHYLTKRGDGESPDPLAFDDIVRIKRPTWLVGEDDLLESVIEVKIPSISVTTLPPFSPLPLNQPINVTVYGDTANSSGNFTVEVVEQIWFDTTTINALQQ